MIQLDSIVSIKNYNGTIIDSPISGYVLGIDRENYENGAGGLIVRTLVEHWFNRGLDIITAIENEAIESYFQNFCQEKSKHYLTSNEKFIDVLVFTEEVL